MRSGFIFRITLSLRDVEEMLAQRRISVRYEIIRCWVNKFGPQIAKNLRRRKAAPSPRWHLDEMICNMNGARVFLWRAVTAGTGPCAAGKPNVAIGLSPS